jgi:phosphinothricin acetyltransferase
VVVEDGGDIVAFAATSAYRARECYSGIAEVSVYVARASRHRSAGRTALAALIECARQAGYWKLVSRVFPENHASRGLIRLFGFREVGTYEKHGKLDGIWRDVIIVERLIPENLKGWRPGIRTEANGSSPSAPIFQATLPARSAPMADSALAR